MDIMKTFAARMVFALIVPVAASCGGDPSPADDPQAASMTATEPKTAGTPWKNMSRDQRLAHMKKIVLPKMKSAFTEVDAARFGHMTCATCHGGGPVKDGSFKMPNPELPQLSVEGGFQKHLQEAPEITMFMMTKVVPDMAALLGVEPYNPTTQQGFGCFACHTKAE